MSKEVGAWLGRRPWRPASGGAPVGAGSPPEVPARWSAARKTEVVLRLLRGDIPDEPLLAAAKAARRRDGLAPSAGPLPTGPSCHYREPIPSRLTHYLTDAREPASRRTAVSRKFWTLHRGRVGRWGGRHTARDLNGNRAGALQGCPCGSPWSPRGCPGRCWNSAAARVTFYATCSTSVASPRPRR